MAVKPHTEVTIDDPELLTLVIKAIVKNKRSFKRVVPIPRNIYYPEFGWVMKNGLPTNKSKEFVKKVLG